MNNDNFPYKYQANIQGRVLTWKRDFVLVQA